MAASPPPWLAGGMWECNRKSCHLGLLVSAAFRQKSILALFGGRQQFVELRTFSEARKQGVGLQGGVGKIVLFKRTAASLRPQYESRVPVEYRGSASS